MATLSLSIGPLTSSKTVVDANAQDVLASVFAYYHPEDADEFTNQEKLDNLVQIIIPLLLIDKARQYEERAARIALDSDPPIFE